MSFRLPTSGKIYFDGRDAATINRKTIRDNMSCVLQRPAIYSGSIRRNIEMGRPGASEAEIEEAVGIAQMADYVDSLPDGLEHMLEQSGKNLSGGQKQRICIARALLADRRLLILDEATSNVDTRTEILIQKAMDKLMRGRTCFVIAHRLSTIVDSDLILVLRDGQIVETGRHEELLARRGFYYDLYTSQYAI